MKDGFGVSIDQIKTQIKERIGFISKEVGFIWESYEKFRFAANSMSNNSNNITGIRKNRKNITDIREIMRKKIQQIQ